MSFAWSVTIRYQSDPGMEHWKSVKRILKYLRSTKDMFLIYGGDKELIVKGYTDGSFITNPEDISLKVAVCLF